MPPTSRAATAALLGAALLMAPFAASASEKAGALFAFIYRPGPAWKPGVAMNGQDLRPHAAYIAGLARDGIVLGGGGFQEVDGGMAIVRAPDRAAAERLLSADPAISSGVFEADLREWRPRFGADADLAPQP